MEVIMKVIIAWGSRKRHIFINGKILCGKINKSGYYTDKIIEFKSLELQDIIRKSICKKCQKKYDQMIVVRETLK